MGNLENKAERLIDTENKVVVARDEIDRFMQGKQNTWYAGEIISFGDMEDTCAASKDLVERFF